jgi:hypothetical protein
MICGKFLHQFTKRCSKILIKALLLGLLMIVFNVFTISKNPAHASTPTWSSPVSLYGYSGAGFLSSVSCPSASFCMAVDGSGNALSYNGSAWSTPVSINGTNSLNSVSCPSASFCMAVDGSGNALSYNGSAWSTPVSINGTNSLNSVSCPSASFCMAGDYYGNYIVYGVSPTYIPISPTRICDTRKSSSSNQCNNGVASSGSIGPNSSIDVNVSGTGPGGTLDNVPASATTIVINVTVTNPTSNGGYLTIYPTGSSKPTSSVINFNASNTIPNLVEVEIGTKGDISIYNYAGSTDLIIDVEGFVAPATLGSGQFVPISPTRICDTRKSSSSNQCNNGVASSGSIGPNSSINVNVSGTGPGGTLDNIPASATAIVINVTVTNPTSNGGYLTIYPSNLTKVPNASNLNFSIGQSIANRVIVPIDTSNGDISIYNYTGNTDVVIDVNGYYTGSSSTSGATFYPMVPTRICDTRSYSPPNQCNNRVSGVLTQGEIITVIIASNISSIPSNATAVVLNVTATDTTSNGGYFTIYPTPASPGPAPLISDLNFSAGQTIANMVVVKIGQYNSINVYNAIGSADLVIDVMGYYV